MVTGVFRNKSIFLDTAPLIYFIEGNSMYQGNLDQVFRANDKGEFIFITSTITLLEVLVKPLKEGQFILADQYKKVLTGAEGILIYDITTETAIKAAELRAKYNLRTPDALQIATAIAYKADYFLTNDLRLKAVTEINSLTLEDINRFI